MEYKKFIEEFDQRLKGYFDAHKEYIKCAAGCADCCKKGDYPLSQVELEYLMQGYVSLPSEKKIVVQNNINSFQKGSKCPFLHDNMCVVYNYRPIICRVHGIAYLCGKKTVKTPYCVNEGKNYSNVYENGMITINPVLENLDTPSVLKGYEYGEIRNLYDWLKPIV